MTKLAGVRIVGFKRFNNLTINDIPSGADLVILAGPNGIGKSSLFDAFGRWAVTHGQRGGRDDPDYYNRRSYGLNDAVGTPEHLRIDAMFHEPSPTEDPESAKKSFYIRSAYRNDPEMIISSISRVGPAIDENRIQRLIENDATVTKNYQRLVSDAFDDVFEKEQGTTTLTVWRESVIGELRDAIARLFPDLILNGLGSPLRDANFRFTKGTSKRFLYKNLSGGEKAVFDLILDIIVKRREYNNTIFCIDEPEVHTNPRIQGRLLRELLNLIPTNCQLWVSTHAIGMLREARDIERETPGRVVFLDFGGHKDFDMPVVLTPTKPTRSFWESALSVALHDLAELVAPETVIVCEGNPTGAVAGKNAEHDARCYTAIFSDEIPEVVFVAGGNSSDVASDRMGFAAKLPAIVQGTSVHRLIDRDDHGPSDVSEFNQKGITVLGRRNIESYLWDDEVLKALCIKRGYEIAIPEVLANKAVELANSISRNNANNDLKPAAPNMFNFIKRRLQIVGEANDSRSFERNILSKLLNNEMSAYQDLKKAIFD